MKRSTSDQDEYLKVLNTLFMTLSIEAELLENGRRRKKPENANELVIAIWHIMGDFRLLELHFIRKKLGQIIKYELDRKKKSRKKKN